MMVCAMSKAHHVRLHGTGCSTIRDSTAKCVKMQSDSLGYVMTSQQLILAVSKPGLACAKLLCSFHYWLEHWH